MHYYREAIRYHQHYHQQRVNGVPPGSIRFCSELQCRQAYLEALAGSGRGKWYEISWKRRRFGHVNNFWLLAANAMDAIDAGTAMLPKRYLWIQVRRIL